MVTDGGRIAITVLALVACMALPASATTLTFDMDPNIGDHSELVPGTVNLDGTVNGLDVDPFVDAVVGGGGAAVVPEPAAWLLLLTGLVACCGLVRRGGAWNNGMPYLDRLVFFGCLSCLGLFPARGFSAPPQPPVTERESPPPSPATTTRQPESDPRVMVTFAAMADVPRSRREEGQLVRQLAELPSDVEFVVHLGDIKGGKTPCDERTYLKVAGLLATSQVPVFVVPGDNEWNDCLQPDCAWRLWERYFSRFERHWQPPFPVTRSPQRDELFSFVQGNVLFIGLNLVGGHVHDSLEWKLRHADDSAWTQLNFRHYGARVERVVVLGHARPTEKQADYFNVLVMESQTFGKPVLYLHGDGHHWSRRHPWKAGNLLAVQLDAGSIAPPVKVMVTDHDDDPFLFDRQSADTAEEQMGTWQGGEP